MTTSDRRITSGRRRGARLAVGLLAGLLLAAPGAAQAPSAPAATIDALVTRLAAMPGFQARFDEEKTIALLAVPLRSSGSLYFVPPQLLLRRVEEPSPSLLRLDADQLEYADADGSERFDLGANPAARVFARTFTDILAGDLPRLRDTYEIAFQPEPPQPGGEWRLDLVPRDPGLAGVVQSLEVRGRGLFISRLVVREASGDVSVTRFRDVDPERHFEKAEIEALQGSAAR